MFTIYTVQLSRCFERMRICVLCVAARRGLSSLASDSQTSRNLARSSRKCAKPFVKHVQRESDMCHLYNLNNLARKVCCKKMFHVECSCPLMSTCMSNLIASITA